MVTLNRVFRLPFRYGDTIPETFIGKLVMFVYSFFGIIFVALPGSILGTGLALKMQEEEKTDVYRVPAAKLIQSVWRYYSTNRNRADSPLWNLYSRSDGRDMNLVDRGCVRFIRLVLYLKQRKRFKMKLGSVKDDFFREKSTKEMSRRLDTILMDLKATIKVNADKHSKKRQQSQEFIKQFKDRLSRIKSKIDNKTEAEKSPDQRQTDTEPNTQLL